MKFKNLFVITVLGIAMVAEPLVARPFSSRGSSSSRSSSSRSSSSSSKSSGGSSGWGGSRSSSPKAPAPSSPSSSGGWGSSKGSGGSTFGGSSDNKSKSSGWSSSDSTKKNITTDNSTDSNKKSSGWGTSSGSTWGTDKKVTGPNGSTSYKAPSKGDIALERKAIQSGTAYKTKDAAMSDFKTKYADKYPTKFNSEPSVRPDYIPRTYSNGGSTYNIVYNSGFGGYGYYNALGAWVAYDIMTDALMMNSLMHRHSYYYPSAPYVGGGGTTVVHTTSGGVGFFWGFMIFLGSMFLIFLIAWAIASKTD